MSARAKSITHEAGHSEHRNETMGGCELSCGICLDGVLADLLILHACQHIFHRECIKQWITKCISIEEIPSCPMCRSTIIK